jgi:hypothetical protein
MSINESKLRSIIREEARRIMMEGWEDHRKPKFHDEDVEEAYFTSDEDGKLDLLDTSVAGHAARDIMSSVESFNSNPGHDTAEKLRSDLEDAGISVILVDKLEYNLEDFSEEFLGL